MRQAALALAILVTLASCAGPGGGAAPTGSPARESLTLAYADDPSRVMLLWGITSGKVTSPFLDLKVSFLPVAQIIPAANTKQYDVIEATPLAIPRTLGAEPGFQIVSNGLVNVGGTRLVTGAASAIRTAADLKGKTVGVPSLGGTFVLETRFVLAKKYGLDPTLPSGDVRFSETPPEAVPQLLRENKLDAAVLTQLGIYRVKDSADFRTLSDVIPEMRAITGRLSVSSILVTYRDRAQAKARAIAELQRMLAASRDHLYADRAQVVKAVAAEKKVEEAYLTWFFDHYQLAGGALSAEDRAQIAAAWEVAKALGDIKDVPRIDEVLWKAP
ncbi:MAG TPA: hypothetical protein VFM93_10340 [Candidatus Limnocylindria bacterium]|nr:hypothetical protein [Candidatus Limnocylindria bacterium]